MEKFSHQPFNVVAKPTGAACNLDCTYCFFLSKELLYDHGSQMMSPETLENYIKTYLESHADGDVTLVWQGGEPTLRGLDFFRLAVELGRKYARPQQNVFHAMQTNATLLNDEWAAFFKENNFLLGVSIDGPQDIHDAFRVNKAGRGSFEQVVRGWRFLEKHGVERNILCTVHAANEERGAEVYRFFRDELQATYLQFIPIVERVLAQYLPLAQAGWQVNRKHQIMYRQEGDCVTDRSVSPAGFGQFMKDIFDEWLVNDIGRVFVQHFDTMLGNLMNVPTVCVHSPVCGAALAIEHNGDVYSCDHYVEEGYVLGNVTAGDSFLEMLQSPFQQDFGQAKLSTLSRKCLSCPVRVFCHGGCPKDRFVAQENDHPQNYLCEGYYDFFSHATPAVQLMGQLLSRGRSPMELLDPAFRARYLKPSE